MKAKKAKMTEITIEIDKELLFAIMLRAHERDITLNQMIHIALKEYIDKVSATPDDALI